jgi:type II secretory pathway predicted ATPase ExeA
VEHLQSFGLTQDPFSNEPDLRFYFESASHLDAQRRVERGLRQRKGLTLLTGDGGMGKTMIARRILDSLEEEVFEAILLVMLPGAADATGILQRFARQLGSDEPASDRARLLAQIYEHLAIVREDGRHAVLMVDDAQIMSPEVFSELGGLVNLEYEDRRLVSILFVGLPDLDRLVEQDASIASRVDVRVRLQPLDMADATKYLKHRISMVNGNPALLPPAAVDALYKFGRGRPRLLNTLADNALFEAYLAGRTTVDASDIERSAADLGIGPDPGSTYSRLSMTAAVPPIVEHTTTAVQGFSDLLSSDTDSDFIPELDLTDSMAIVEEPPAAATIDLDAGLEAALEDFATDVSEVAENFDTAEISSDGLILEDEPVAAVVEADSAQDTEIVEVVLAPIEPGDEFDDVFVELIEE